MKSAEKLLKNIDSLEQIIDGQKAEIRSQKYEITLLKEKLNLAIQKRFAAQSEKHSPDQLGLFNEAEQLDEADLDTESEENKKSEVKPHQRKKPGRKPLPASLPRIDVIHDLNEADKVCPHDGHTLKHIGDEISEQLEVIPAKLQVIRHIRPKYVCPCCDQGLKTAPLPPQPIPKSQAAPGLLAYVAVSKYVDALPLYRQSTIFGRIGVQLNRSTMANWMIKAGQLVQPLINLMQDNILSYDIIQMDETRVQPSFFHRWLNGQDHDKEIFTYPPSQ
jgi:transposase